MGMMIHRRREGHLHYPKVGDETKVETKVETEVKPQEPEIKADENIKKEVVYTRDEINKLPFFSLKKVAASEGIDVTGKKTSELRDALIEKMGL